MALIHITKMIRLLASDPTFDNGTNLSRSTSRKVLLKKYQSFIGKQYNTENPDDFLSSKQHCKNL